MKFLCKRISPNFSNILTILTWGSKCHFNVYIVPRTHIFDRLFQGLFVPQQISTIKNTAVNVIVILITFVSGYPSSLQFVIFMVYISTFLKMLRPEMVLMSFSGHYQHKALTRFTRPFQNKLLHIYIIWILNL